MKVLVTCLVFLLLLLQYQLWFKQDNIFDTFKLKQQLTQQQQANKKLQAKNKALTAEVLELKRGQSAVEAHAREDLGMVKKGETFYQVVPD